MTTHGNRLLRKVYITEDEDRYFKNLQGQCRLKSFSSFARRAMLYFGNYGNYFVIEGCKRHCELMEETRKELSAIGNNINQIAHQVNTFALQGKIPEEYAKSVIAPAIEKLQALYARILDDDEKIKKRQYGHKLFGRTS